jgi:FkbH-like protein
VILAVNSKNNDADAREPFLKHAEMVLKLDDFAMFVANWERKPDNIRRIAQTLNIGLDSLVFVDDNPAEREIMRQFVPEVEVLTLPADPSGYARALNEYLMFETSAFTAEDAAKTEQYRAKAQIAELEANAGSIEDFYRSLQMQAVVEPFDDLHLPRIVQLLGKTNQFNLTTRRHGEAQIRAFMNDANCVHWYLKLRDRFADHGLVSMIIARREGGGVMDIDSWLMSCRVIGRTVEAELLSHVSEAAARLGCTAIRGTYVPTAKNGMVKEIFAQFGFEKTATAADGTTTWMYDLKAKGPIVNGFIQRLETAGVGGASMEAETADAA